MEEIYIIKLKGLPASSQESLRDSKASFYYRKDLTGEALLGFGVMHTIAGLLLIVLTTINLVRIDWRSVFVLGSGIWCGAIFAITGFMAIICAHKRKSDISKSKIQVKIFFGLSIITLLLTTAYLILFLMDLKEVTFNEYIGIQIVMAFISELFTSLLSLFTCMRVIWPGSLPFCAKHWPMHQKLKRKIIVSTQIYTNGVKQQNEDMIRNLGPNCVISLGPPPNEAITTGAEHFGKSYDNKNENFVTICEFCEQNDNQFKSNICDHNLRLHCLNEEDVVDEYDSEFDVDNFDSMVGHQVCDSTHHPSDDHNYHTDVNDFTHETENKYETIDGNTTSDESKCLDVSEINDKSEDEDREDNQIKEPVINSSEMSSESIDSPKSCEISEELNDV